MDGMRPRGRLLAAVLLLATPAVTVGCSTTADERPPRSTESSPLESTAPRRTAGLDSVAVIGHSGATGTMSDPANPSRNATENSWATGENPAVESVYARLLETHPALEGHNYNGAVNGSTVDMLGSQFDAVMAEADSPPDLVLVQTIDNDMRCDGTDAQNYQPFARTLARQLAYIDSQAPGVQFFLVSQWATVEAWARWAGRHQAQVLANSGTGPCDVFDDRGRIRPAGVRSMQRIVDGYWHAVERVCSAQRGCHTDRGAEQREFVPTDHDLSVDLNHLSVDGHAKFARIAWHALPDDIKDAS